MIVSNPLKKLQKTHAKKIINEKVTEKWSFTFITKKYVQKFWAVTFFGCYSTFLTDSDSASNFAFYDTHIKFLVLAYMSIFVITLKPKLEETAQKFERLIYKCCGGGIYDTTKQ